MIFVASDESMIALQPGKASLDFPSSTIAAKRSPILKQRSFATTSVRTNQFDVRVSQCGSQPIGIGGPIVNQPLRKTLIERRTDERFDHVDFSHVRTDDNSRQRNAATIDHQTDLGAFTFLRQTNAVSPFFAGENVASAMHSSQRSCLKASSFPRSLNHAFWNTPERVHSSSRRQHVAGLGYRSGKSCHRAPVRSTHNTPSKHCRGGTRGRPPLQETGGFGNRSSIRSHWESERYGAGAVLDPVLLDRRTVVRPYRVMSMSVSFHSNTHAIPLPNLFTNSEY